MVERDKFEYAQEMKRPLDVPLFHYCIFFSHYFAGNKAEKRKDNEGEITQNTSSETDLTVVLNAWYSAGFYTGK
jgi:hypothetical protein